MACNGNTALLGTSSENLNGYLSWVTFETRSFGTPVLTSLRYIERSHVSAEYICTADILFN